MSVTAPRATIDLGAFDVAVIGGDVAGTICAAVLADEGYRVVVVEPRGSLMWQVTRARQTALLLDEVGEVSPVSAAYCDALAEVGGVRDTLLEPVLAQLTADRFLTSRGVRVLFQARAIAAHRNKAGDLHSISVAVKGAVGALRVSGCVDCSDGATLLRAGGTPVRSRPSASCVWSLTFVDAQIEAPQEITLDANGVAVPARARPAFWPGDCQVDFAFPPAHAGTLPPELFLARHIDSVVAQLRAAAPGLAGAKLAHVGEEPWAAPPFTVVPGLIQGGGNPHAHAISLRIAVRRTGVIRPIPGEEHAPATLTAGALCYGRGFAGAGAWTEGVDDDPSGTARLDQPGRIVSNLFLAGEAAGRQMAALLRQPAKPGA